MKKYLITSALPYANGYIHLGHAAGAYLPADLFVRYLRLNNEDVAYICGSDEHGVAITISAEKEKVTPKDIIDKYHNANHEAFQKFGMTFDIYSRTSEAVHHETAREFFEDFLAKGLLIEKEEEQFYDISANMFLPDRYVEGICPNCGSDKARGDQCDSCGAYYNQIELKNPISIISKKTPEVRKTTHWYFKFNELQEFLENYIEAKSKEWKDNVIQQTRSWLKAGLTERAITRDLNWGVRIDGLNGVDNDKAFGKVLYVWFDAVLGYISATKIWGENNNQDWKSWWQGDNTEYYAFIGKDNIVFHTLIFPAMLHARGGYILPENVPANEFLNLEGQKISKSRNWSIDMKDFFNDFTEYQQVDALRYTLAMSFPETKDSDFTWKDFQARNNNELASIYGNFINRSLQFLHKNFEGKVPELTGKYSNLEEDWKNLTIKLNQDVNFDTTAFADIYGTNFELIIRELTFGKTEIDKNYKKFRFRDAITSTMNIARAANKFFNDEEPWKSVKSDKEKCAAALFVCCQLVKSLSVFFAPVLPFSSAKILTLLGENNYTGEENNKININIWEKTILPTLEQGRAITQPEIIFKHIENDVIEAQMAKLGDNNAKPEIKEEDLITIDDFAKVQLKTAKVIAAEKLPKSKKLLKLQVDLGNEKRQILAGVAEYYKPEDILGKTIVVVANLKPAKLMGEESQGMMLAASIDGKLCFVTPEKDEIGPGALVK